MDLLKVHYIMIDINNTERRIDNYLFSYLKNVPHSIIYKLIRTGQIRINKKRIKSSYKLNILDKIRIPPITIVNKKPIEKIIISSKWKNLLSNITLFEDNDLLIINKPAGIAVHGGTNVTNGLINILRVIRSDIPYLQLIHRLDKDTSGCLLLAKNENSLIKMHRMLKTQQINKYYVALILGKWPENLNIIKVPLRKNNDKIQESITHVTLIKSFDDISMIKIIPYTGRNHQIRIHCQFYNHPIIGDDKYYINKSYDTEIMKKYNIKRLCLHAYKLSLYHPITNKYIEIIAEENSIFKNLFKLPESIF